MILSVETPDIITAGFPCQGMSIAGKGGGFRDDRSALFFEFIRVARRLRPSWILIENVPGFRTAPVGSKGRDFTIALAELDKLGYGVAWTSLDAQYFGLAQRRKRVFIVGCLGKRCPPEILFESEGVSGDSPPSRKAGTEITGGIAACLNSGGNAGGFRSEPGEHIVTHALRAEGHDASEDGTGRGTPIVTAPLTGSPYGDHVAKESLLVAFGGNKTSGPIDKATTCNAHGGQGRMDFESETFVVGPLCSHTKKHGHAMGTQQAMEAGQIVSAYRTAGNCGPFEQGDKVGALNTATDQNQNILLSRLGVRRLTPRECERLQGFPDDWTLVSYRNKPMSDSARYRMLGNAVAVPVAEWILRRLAATGVKTVGETFAGISGFGLAAARVGLHISWASEINEQARAIYSHHFPSVELHGDIREFVV